ncbi:cysteine desulfurase family protein [Alicyclobacillus contaminans]|uniref:cysteine desulfurase family protein n=1 Tax=Alicyclobacillus contaminans TaxID=392016 RepID=UPI00047DECB0|nr:cysteine desulfurase family protein [Alicyclobacillus contaminans]
MTMIYLDNAATTAVHPDVLDAMMPYLTNGYGNASSIHALGREAKAALQTARERVALLIGAHPQELVFTSGGTESIHAALYGTLLAGTGRRHVVTTALEHHAVLHTCAFLESLGYSVTYVAPREDGRIHPDDVASAVTADTLLVSVMSVNNETGVILPVDEIAAAVKARDAAVLVHSDMVQALGTLRLQLDQRQVDLASFSAHKVHGPKGVGALYIRRGTPWRPVLHGGTQERERRAGTENVAGIVGFGAAAERLRQHWDDHQRHVRQIRDVFWDMLSARVPVERNGGEPSVPAILNVWFPGVRNDRLLMRLDLAGVAASAGSACTAGSLEPSHVLQAMGYEVSRVHESLRFSFSDFTSESDVRTAVQHIEEAVNALRR